MCLYDISNRFIFRSLKRQVLERRVPRFLVSYISNFRVILCWVRDFLRRSIQFGTVLVCWFYLFISTAKKSSSTSVLFFFTVLEAGGIGRWLWLIMWKQVGKKQIKTLNKFVEIFRGREEREAELRGSDAAEREYQRDITNREFPSLKFTSASKGKHYSVFYCF